jgi:hypothetical protein
MSESIESLWKAATDLLNLPSKRLFALGSAALVAVGGLAVVAHLDPATFGAGAQSISAAFLAFGLTSLVLGVFQAYAEANTRTFEFSAIGHECWAHVVSQRDGRVTTQIVCDLRVFNLTDQTRWLTDIQLVRPRTRGRMLNHMIMVHHQTRVYYGPYEIPPRGRSDARGHMIVDADLSRGIERRGITVRIADQDKHWHTIRFPDAFVHSRAVVPPTVAPALDDDGVAVEPRG